ncbi:MFS transporter [Tersicoccus solisilvae]|uniref:MFS transporter n=1 Tax=Tersicoccus solisilvae TaxID=1882339 RepID=A0ABQ1PK40_9MICC|nr:MFS transporter [Tersicoccus solisilvae]GGC98557.1 MFS transporter [Tersicoccus solisilvae]
MTAEFAGYRRGSPGYRRVIAALACAGVVTFAQLYSPQGVLPLIAADLRIGASDAGLTISAATAGLALSVVVWSFVADRFGRVQTMRVAIVLATALGLAVAVTPDYGVLLTLRVLEGVALGGVPALAIAYLSEEIHPFHAALAAGTYVAGTTVGGLLGRIVAGPLGEWLGWRAGMLTVSVLAAVAAVGFVLLAPTPRGFVPSRRADRDEGGLALLLMHLRNPRMLAVFAQGMLLMGGFVAVYNYLGFRLEGPPWHLPHAVISAIFVAYLAGTVSSPLAGRLAASRGRRPVLLGATGVLIAGVLMTATPWLPVILTGVLVLTAGFFGAHAVASGWAGARARTGRAQATSLYNLAYYVGSSVFGWLGGVLFGWWGWSGTAALVVGLAGVAMALALLVLPKDPTRATGR